MQRRLLQACFAFFILAIPWPGESALANSWRNSLTREIESIDAATPGAMGVFIRRLDTGESLDYAADRPWYLASTTKVPVAVALLQKVEAGTISLRETMLLKTSDYLDGSGDLVWQAPGTRVSVEELLEKMLTQSDSTAADMLIRRIGVEALNAQVHDNMVADGFGPLTTLLQVRQEAYGELHPKARALTNLDIIALKGVAPAQRLNALLKKLAISESELNAPSLDEAYERYYQRGKNSSTLTAYGRLLERLTRGELLSPSHTQLVLRLMEKMETGERRIKAGLPANMHFAQKTGTQLARICNMGIVRREDRSQAKVVVTACLEKFPDQRQAEGALKKLGAAMARSGVLE